MAVRISPAIDLSDLTRALGRRSPGPGIEDLITNGEPMTGTGNDDFMFGLSGAAIDSTINANGGDDFVLADMGAFYFSVVGNGSPAGALDLDGFINTWTIDENPLFGDSSIPHLTYYFTATMSEFEYFKIVIPAGETITIDVDFGRDSSGLGFDFALDTFIRLYAPGQDPLGNSSAATGDDSLVLLGGLGSSSTADSYLSYTASVAGTYIIKLLRSGDETFAGGEEMIMNVSLTDHAVHTPTAMGDDTIDGGEGNDLLLGLGGDDLILGGQGVDLMYGGSGADMLSIGFGGVGHIAHGGDGSDTIDFSYSTDSWVVDLAAGTADAFGTNYATLVSVENAVGGSNNDTLMGDAFANHLDGGAGVDTLHGGGGGDVLLPGGSYANDQLFGGDGDDTITSSGRGLYAGEADDDYIYAGITIDASPEQLDGGGGIDTLDTTSFGGDTYYAIDMETGATDYEGSTGGENFIGFENLISGSTDDSITGTTFHNDIRTFEGDDTVTGGGGSDTLTGGLGEDALSGGPGADTLLGTAGVDTLNGGAGADVLDGGGDLDWADYSGGPRVIADLQIAANNTGHAAGDSYASIANLRGGDLADNLRGNANPNRIEGGVRNDVLSGRAGDDTLVGGPGFDQLAGQQGVDFFLLTSPNPVDYDRIVDLALNETILLDAAAFGLAPGALDPDAFVLGAGAQDAEDRLIYLESVGKLFFDPDGAGGATRQLIAIIANRPTLDASDFLVI